MKTISRLFLFLAVLCLTGCSGEEGPDVTVSIIKETHIVNISPLPGEGCEFEADVLSNDYVESMKLPEWISFVSSRSLTKYIYKFKAEPNKTGKERSGTIIIYGEDSSGKTTVTQKPYNPTGIEIDGIDNVILADGKTYTFPIKPVPEYAGTSELKVSITAGSAFIKDGNIHICCDTAGTHTLEVMLGNKNIYTKEITFVSPEISLNVRDGAEYCIGQPFEITADIPQEYAEISVPDETILKKKDGKYVFTKEGEAEITARNILSGKETKIHVYSSYITFSDISSSMVQIGSYSILSIGTVANMYDAESYTIYITVGTDSEKLATKEGTGSGQGKLTAEEYSCTIKGNFNKEDLWIHVETVTSNGEKKTKSIHL